MKKELLDKFWNIYEEEGTVKALTWLESLKYYEDYCINTDITIDNMITSIKNINLN
jgi:hypothetical protein